MTERLDGYVSLSIPVRRVRQARRRYAGQLATNALGRADREDGVLLVQLAQWGSAMGLEEAMQKIWDDRWFWLVKTWRGASSLEPALPRWSR